jgi:hypothetical protein
MKQEWKVARGCMFECPITGDNDPLIDEMLEWLQENCGVGTFGKNQPSGSWVAVKEIRCPPSEHGITFTAGLKEPNYWSDQHVYLEKVSPIWMVVGFYPHIKHGAEYELLFKLRWC